MLKFGDTFAVFDCRGDITGPGELGLYHEGTRHLSVLGLTISGKPPLLLSSRTSASDELFGADLSNPDIIEGDSVKLPRDLVHVFRSRFLVQGQAHERIRLVNYSQQHVRLPLRIAVGADFADIFEVRGTQRARRGTLLPPHVERKSIELAYKGLDNVVRRTRIGFEPAPRSLTDGAAEFSFDLEPDESRTIELTVDCRPADERRSHPDFDAAFAFVERHTEDKQRDSARISTSNAQFNSWLSRSLSDVRLMTTDTEHGPYPYAGVPWFSTEFGRDGLITALEMLWLNPALSRGVLQFLAATQADAVVVEQDAEPGKILHETRGGEMAALGEVPFGRYYGSVDSTPLFIVLAYEYYRAHGRPRVRAVHLAQHRARVVVDARYGDLNGDGFLEYQRRTPNGLVQQGWKDSQDSVFHDDGTLAEAPIALCEVQGYAFAALRGAALLARALEQGGRADTLDASANALREAFEAAFWLEDLGTYALALDGANRPCRVRSSNPGHCLLTGIADPDGPGASRARSCRPRCFRAGDQDRRHEGSALQPDVVPQRIGVAARQRPGLRRIRPLRPDGCGDHRRDGAVRRQPARRAPADAGAVLRLPPPRPRGADALSGGLRAAGVGCRIGVPRPAVVPRRVNRRDRQARDCLARPAAASSSITSGSGAGRRPRTPLSISSSTATSMTSE